MCEIGYPLTRSEFFKEVKRVLDIALLSKITYLERTGSPDSVNAIHRYLFASPWA